MPSYPNRCQHIKVNGTQCGSPALRRNKFCFFHKEWHEQKIQINANRARRARSISLPVLEDANSIQVALMQVMRMIVAKEIDSKTAGLLLYALQTASVNLRNTQFEPGDIHEVVLDRRNAANASLGESELWCDEDFGVEEDEEEDESAQKKITPEDYWTEVRRREEKARRAQELREAKEAEEEDEDWPESEDEVEADPGKKPAMPDMSEVRQELSEMVVAHAPRMLAPMTEQEKLEAMGLPSDPWSHGRPLNRK